MSYNEYVVKDSNNVLVNLINLTYGKRILSSKDLSRNIIEVKYEDIKDIIDEFNTKKEDIINISNTNKEIDVQSTENDLKQLTAQYMFNIINNINYTTDFEIINH